MSPPGGLRTGARRPARRGAGAGAGLLDELVEETPALLARLQAPAEPPAAAAPAPTLPISDIVPDPQQPRRQIHEGALADLAASIRERGILQPLTVRPAPDWNGYVLVFGERRYRAALLAGLTHVPALIRADLSEADVLDLQWRENAEREDIDDVDKALH
jgi:ParB family chromosome partitioning protein